MKKEFFISYILLDSRNVIFPEQSLFFALDGTHVNGHQFVESLYQKGVRCFVITEHFNTDACPEAVFFKVPNVLLALQKLVAYHRQQFSLPVVGITGSNGKTMVKEMLFQLLHYDYKIAKSPKSFNSQIGVPLSLWQLTNTDELGIFEAGISQPGEMDLLQKMIAPTWGVFTYLGTAHASGFSSISEKINEKLKLFINSEWLFFNADDEQLSEAILHFKQHHHPQLKCFTWGKSLADVKIISIKKIEHSTVIQYQYKEQANQFTIPFTDDASIHNVCHCLALLLFLNLKPEVIQARMLLLKPVAMRLEIVKGINNCVIINDSYSADVNSLQLALDFLKQQNYPKKHSLILSDVPQTGLQDEELYAFIGHLLQQKEIDKFIGVGPQLMAMQKHFASIPEKYFFESTKQCLQQISALAFAHETILIKGARQFEFEHINKYLEQKQHQTVLEINLTALRNNFQFYKKLLSPQVGIMAMVKAFSYGSGSYEVAAELEQVAVDYLAVAYTDEGVELRKARIQLPIMVMNCDDNSFDHLVRYALEPELYSKAIFKKFKQYLQVQNIKHFPVHIKLDTGMHRLGFEAADVDFLIEALTNDDTFLVKSIFSHLAASDAVALNDFTHQQIDHYLKMANQIEMHLGYTVLKHIANSTAIHRFPKAQLNMVRLGIGLYGVDADPKISDRLQTVVTLKTTIAQIKLVKKGEAVGYGRHAMVTEDTKIATVRLGYADGYPRALGNGVGKMLVNGKLAPVVGNICMDMTMLNVNGIAVKEEDEVIVFGQDLPVTELAKWNNSIAYEILTGVSQRVKRLYFKE